MRTLKSLTYVPICPACKGEGTVQTMCESPWGIGGMTAIDVRCPHCEGSGSASQPITVTWEEDENELDAIVD